MGDECLSLAHSCFLAIPAIERATYFFYSVRTGFKIISRYGSGY